MVHIPWPSQLVPMLQTYLPSLTMSNCLPGRPCPLIVRGRREPARRSAQVCRCSHPQAVKVVEYTDSWTDIAFIALCRKVSVLIELSYAICSAFAGK